MVIQPIDAAGLDILRADGVAVDQARSTDRHDLYPLLAEADAVITRNFGLPSEAMAQARRLRVIGVHGTGMDRVDLATARERGIRVVNTPGSNAQSVAEHALALMLAAARHLPDADRELRAGNFNWRLTSGAYGIELSGRTLGLWGFGHVARRLARMAQGIGMQVIVLSAHAEPAELAAEGLTTARDADDLLARADILSLHGLPGPRPLVGTRELALMRRGAILVNTARGALVDETALIAALEDGQLRSAALDVFVPEPLPAGSPLTTCPNLILTPHIGGTTLQAMQTTAQDVARAVLAALAHRP
ncbi:MAG: NAD(P)-dependent oxidoreductase [Mesorhizobium sp.]